MPVLRPDGKPIPQKIELQLAKEEIDFLNRHKVPNNVPLDIVQIKLLLTIGLLLEELISFEKGVGNGVQT